METATCKNCAMQIVRVNSYCSWMHYPSMKLECRPTSIAEPMRDSENRVIPFGAKEPK